MTPVSAATDSKFERPTTSPKSWIAAVRSWALTSILFLLVTHERELSLASNEPNQQLSFRTSCFHSWEENGHFYTTFSVAMATGGRGHDDAFKLAYFSQLPDEVKEYDAVHQAALYLFNSTRLLNTSDPHQRMVIATRIKYSQDVCEVLHSLHGSDVSTRRKALKDLIKNGTLTISQMGLAIHAFGDAYAHVFKNKAGDWLSYELPLGHLEESVRGVSPDSIAINCGPYKEYVVALYEALGGVLPESNESLKKLLSQADTFKNAGTKMGDQNKKMEGLSKEPPFSYNNTYSPLGDWKVDDTLGRLTRRDVSDLMRSMKEHLKKY